MKLNQDLLILVVKVLETNELTTADDVKLIISSVNYLYLITDCQSWKALQKNMSTNHFYCVITYDEEECETKFLYFENFRRTFAENNACSQS